MKIKIILFLLSIFLLIACDDEDMLLFDDIDGSNNMVNIDTYKKYTYNFHKQKMFYKNKNIINMRPYNPNNLLNYKKIKPQTAKKEKSNVEMEINTPQKSIPKSKKNNNLFKMIKIFLQKLLYQ
ncbi:hypothetical protein [Blattabacterium cuenoti]|uniref:hypothetical protein n=1 Tax=Blattabacterium cuenoti TaxID=1653831 RepID=UPI00163C307D|nr:hypothetical protein [Blattabacterium cuenoti]